MAVKTHWDVTFKCGHTENRDLTSKPAGKRASFASWLSTQDECTACWRENHKDELHAQRKALAERNQEHLGLPDLDGTEAQLEWASIFRNNLIIKAHEELVDDGDMAEEDFEARILEPARTITRAGWWMDNIDSEPEDLEELVSTANEEADPGTITENPY